MQGMYTNKGIIMVALAFRREWIDIINNQTGQGQPDICIAPTSPLLSPSPQLSLSLSLSFFLSFPHSITVRSIVIYTQQRISLSPAGQPNPFPDSACTSRESPATATRSLQYTTHHPETHHSLPETLHQRRSLRPNQRRILCPGALETSSPGKATITALSASASNQLNRCAKSPTPSSSRRVSSPAIPVTRENKADSRALHPAAPPRPLRTLCTLLIPSPCGHPLAKIITPSPSCWFPTEKDTNSTLAQPCFPLPPPQQL
ncbi:unnamed protein product [Periconia digitata]|uniref:Uncharacterized protein n=1 Tax=Periconia digitata TaxID=1303443 RepID=A0A9W4XQW5_9PLEO|nr:unnamed protein product [Periconia digitata]